MNIKIRLSQLLFVFFSLLYGQMALAANEIHRMRSNSLQEKLQIVLDVSEFPTFNAFALSSPVRVVVDVNARAAKDYRNKLSFKNRGVTLVRTGMPDKDKTRIVLDLHKDFHWEVYALSAEAQYGNRVVIDVYDGKPGKISGPIVDKKPLKPNAIALESSPGDSSNTRASKKPLITLESSKPNAVVSANQNPARNNTSKAQTSSASRSSTAASNSTAHSSNPSNGRGVTLTKAPVVVSTASKKARAKITKETAVKKTLVPVTLQDTTDRSVKQREIIVVIDPGHGGKDSGARGRRGTKEKDVVLQIAKRLKRKVDAMKGMRAVLTRSTDRYISLRGRLYLARKYKADLFVSIHADAFSKPSARGSSVFILSTRGASSEAARWLAKGENAVDLKYGVDIADYETDVSRMIMGIQQDATIESSHILANKTLSRLKGIGKVHKSRVERAGFAVLKSPDIPSILVETAFISNPDEEKKLRSSHYQDKLARSIAQGIQQYFREHIPHHLLLLK